MPTTITLNGQPHTLTPDSPSITDLIADLDLTGQPLAVEVNKAVIPKKQHDTHTLSPNDTVEVVTLVGGG